MTTLQRLTELRLLGFVERAKSAELQVDPNELFPEFTPPQSFLYLSPADFQRVMRAMFPSEELA